jgi:2-polyprenyl-3-methyl-5-hydroxy-6-metoxy-1,4-benzoquinol methylase
MNAAPLIERTVAGLHPFLLERLPRTLRSDSPILDVGCGTGAWLARLAAAGYTNLDGTDRDVAQLAFGGARVFDNDLNDPVWKVGQPRYELITAIEVIEHLDNVGALLANARRLLADDGHLLVTTPNIESIGSRLRFLVTGDMKHFGEIGDRTHIFPILGATMERLAAARRLRVVERFGYPESGRSLTARPWVNVVCTLLRAALPEAAPGDNSCFLLAKD